MSQQKIGWGVVILGFARMILHDRAMRRKFLAQILIADLVVFSVGQWLIAGWLWESAVRVAIWMLICCVITLLLMIFAVYDALAVIREEREKLDNE